MFDLLIKPFIDDLHTTLNALELEHGEISLFGIFRREESSLWDLLVTAPWLSPEGLDDLKTVCASVQTHLRGDNALKLSHVEIRGCDEPMITYLLETYDVPTGFPMKKIDAEDLSDRLPFVIDRGYLLRCRKITRSEDHRTISVSRMNS